MFDNFSQETEKFFDTTDCQHGFVSVCMKREGELLVVLMRAKMWLFGDGLGCR
jgi:hypothetical protein